MKFCKIAFILLAVLFISACSKNKEIKFDNSEPFALIPDVEWAVIIDPYAPYHTEANILSPVAGVSAARKGNILKVLGKSVCITTENRVEKVENWFRFADGWLPESAMVVYSNRMKAVTAVKKMEVE